MTTTRGANSTTVATIPGGDLRPIWVEEARRLHETWPKVPGASKLLTGGGEQVHFARFWRTGNTEIFECTQTYDVADHRIFLPIAPWNLTFKVGAKSVFETTLHPGQLSLTGPITNTRYSLYRGDYHTFCITVPHSLLAEAAATSHRHSITPGMELFDGHVAQDDVMTHLALALFSSTVSDVPPEPIYLDSLGLALAAHMVSRYFAGKRGIANSSGIPLANWRLKRVTEYIETHLVDDLRLADLAGLAGLSRMHFAAQFRVATGFSPHAYVMQRRIEMARSLLLHVKTSVNEVALATGFKSNAHFIRQFRRIVGASPGRWRDSVLRDGARVYAGSDIEGD